LIEWVKADGKAEDLAEPEWEDFLHRRSNCSHLFDVLDRWAKGYGSAELMKGAQLRRIPYAEVRSPEAALEDPQLAERGFFVAVPEPDLGTSITYPGAPFCMSRTQGSVRRPPRTGEHTDEILSELLQLEAAEIERLRADGIV
jgi:crotonobetainyl-CoA:carnitine CoA-transferase CaiB-like acyl-CoA transferase